MIYYNYPYLRERLTVTPLLVSGPGVEPVTLDEVKLWVRQDLAIDDAQLEGLAKAAREWFETACDRAFVEATWALYLPTFPPVELAMPYPPLRDVVSVTYLDQDEVLQTLPTTTYDVVTSRTPGLLRLAYGMYWPIPAFRPEAVCITFRSGRDATVPELVKNGIRMLTAFWYENRGDGMVQAGRDLPIPPAVERIAVASMSHRF